jgi:translation elongation factor aEF-1 beta
MGKIIIVYKIFPTESTVDLNVVKEQIKEKVGDIATINKFAEEPIAFGLCALKVNMVLPEEEGIADETEKRIATIEGVGQIQTLGLTRL